MICVHSSVLNGIRSLLILFNGVLNLRNVTQNSILYFFEKVTNQVNNGSQRVLCYLLSTGILIPPCPSSHGRSVSTLPFSCVEEKISSSRDASDGTMTSPCTKLEINPSTRPFAVAPGSLVAEVVASFTVLSMSFPQRGQMASFTSSKRVVSPGQTQNSVGLKPDAPGCGGSLMFGVISS